MRLIRLLKKDLTEEISTWVEQEIITSDQARSICKLYDVDYDKNKNYSGAYRLLVSLGFLFIGVALIILLGANWEEIPRGLRMAGLLFITMGTHALAFKLYLSHKESGAAGLFMLGNLFYGASIILIAQIYHLGEHMPDGVFWWALGSLPFGVLLRHSWLTLFSCLLALLWFFIEYDMGFYPALFPLFIIAGIYVLVKGQQSNLLFLIIIASIGLWVETLLSAAWLSEGYKFKWYPEHFLISVALFVFAYACSHWLHSRGSGKAKDYGVLLSLWALRFGLIALFVLSFEEPWESLIEASWVNQSSMWMIIFVVMVLALWIGWNTKKLLTIIPIVLFSVGTMVIVVWTNDSTHGIYFQIIFNVVLVGSGISLIIKGIHNGVTHYFFLGISTILITALLRYIDLIGEYVGGAILFMVFAALLLGAAKYWKVQQEKRS